MFVMGNVLMQWNLYKRVRKLGLFLRQLFAKFLDYSG